MQSPRALLRVIGPVAVAATLGCRPNLAPLAPKSVVSPVSLCSSDCRDSVEITYLGASGFLIRHGTNAVLTAPSFTHSSLLKTILPFFSIDPNEDIILTMMANQRLDGVSSILVGHAHYDHLLDAPYIATKLTPSAKIYGGPTVKNILWAIPELQPRLVELTGGAVGDRLHRGDWFPSASAPIRFMAIRNNHPPNFYVLGAFPYTYARGNVTKPRTTLPRTPRGWKLGETYAYVIDIMGPDNRPIFRIFYQDAAGEPRYSALPPLLGDDERPVDVAIICAGNFGYATSYPTALLRTLQPKHVIVGHWEDFFRAPLPVYQPIRFTDTFGLARRIQEQQKGAWVTPEPRARIVYRF
jgi:hypothetical protein